MLLGSDKPALIAASTLISLAVAAVSVINDIFEKSLFLLPLYPWGNLIGCEEPSGGACQDDCVGFTLQRRWTWVLRANTNVWRSQLLLFTIIFYSPEIKKRIFEILPSTCIFRLKGHVAILVCSSLTTEITTCSDKGKEQTTGQGTFIYCGCPVARLLFYQAVFLSKQKRVRCRVKKNKPDLISCSSWGARLQLVRSPTYFARLPYLYYCCPPRANALAVTYACPRCVHTERGCRQVNHYKDFEKVTQLHHNDSCLGAVDSGLLRVVGAYCRD